MSQIEELRAIEIDGRWYDAFLTRDAAIAVDANGQITVSYEVEDDAWNVTEFTLSVPEAIASGVIHLGPPCVDDETIVYAEIDRLHAQLAARGGKLPKMDFPGSHRDELAPLRWELMALRRAVMSSVNTESPLASTLL